MRNLQRVMEVAVAQHAGQTRKAKMNGVALPYIFHPFDVVRRLWHWGIVDEDMLVTAICHDLLEDTGISTAILKIMVGDKVFEWISELTFVEPDKDAKAAKKQYMASFMKKSVESLVVKVADRILNVEDFLDDPKTVDYAPKYYHKADSLWDALYERRYEIVKIFGSTSFNAIDIDYRKLAYEVGGMEDQG